MSTQPTLRESFERERLRVRERRAAQYIAAKRARVERGVGSLGLPEDMLKEVVLLSCVRTVGRLRAASVELKDAVDTHADELWPELVEARFPTAVRVARLRCSPPRSAEEWIALYRRQIALTATNARVEAAPDVPELPPAEALSRYIFSLEAFARAPSGPDTCACPACTLEQPYSLRCHVCNAALPRRAFNESLVWAWAGHPEIHGDDALYISVPQPENIVRQMFAPDSSSQNAPRIRLMVTRAKDGMTAKLYEGMCDDDDGELLFYEWDHCRCCAHGALYGFLHDLQIEMPYFPMIRPILCLDDEPGFVLEPKIDTEDDPINLRLTQLVKLLDTCITFT